MRRGVAILVVLAWALSAHAGDDLGGKITSGKARKLADQGTKLMKEADAIHRRWVLEEIPKDKLLEELERGIKLYDAGAAKLQQALDIQEDGGVLHRLQVGAKRLQQMRFMVHFRLKPQTRPKPRPKPDEKPDKKPEPEQVPEPKPRPEPKPPPPSSLDEENDRGPAVAFEANRAPAVPVLAADLPELPMSDEDRAAALKRDKKGIQALIKAYLGARKIRKLTHRCKLCKGKGVFSDGERCDECDGTGHRINLYQFRKAFWNSFTPLLRDSPGALDALRAFHKHASVATDALGPQVKTFRIRGIEHFGFWAKVNVDLKTEAGEEKAAWTVVSIGSNWYFYTPATDAQLVPREG